MGYWVHSTNEGLGMDIFADSFKTAPYWWENSPRPTFSSHNNNKSVDIAVIGSGYTGLCSAIVLARAGRPVVVFDSEDAGWGCSTRNGGQISTSIKPQYKSLIAKYGKNIAFRIIKEGHNSLAWIKEFVAREKLDCSFQVSGRFHAAHNQKQFDNLIQQAANQPEGLEVPSRVIPRIDQENEVGTNIYYGGVVYDAHASLDPGRYHQELLRLAINAGVTIIPNCPVSEIKKHSGKFELDTTKGVYNSQDVVVATNGYTGKLTPWLSRRVIRIGSYMIATEALNADLMDQLMPRDRVVSDTRKVVYYYRPSPDRRRIIFGGRVTSGESHPKKSGKLLREDLVKIFPQLDEMKITHSWMGYVAYTFDELPHIGNHEGLYYAMGCCGSGVGMASYLGTRMGYKVLGSSDGGTGLDDIQFKSRPFYNGNPWFLPASVAYYRWRDGIG